MRDKEKWSEALGKRKGASQAQRKVLKSNEIWENVIEKFK